MQIFKASIKSKKRKRVSNETLLIYAPLAERLGFENWKYTLENISFKNLHPDIFNRINDKIDNSFKNLEDSFLELESIIHKALEKENIEFSIYHRKKNPYSIWKKINKKNIDLNSISDLAAVRIITKSTRDCYKVLGIIHRNFSAKIGTPVKCTGDGVVTKAQFDTRFGNFIEIDHGFSYKTVYAHLKDGLLVKKGDKVKRGQSIAYLGNTGRSTAPHLHYEVKFKNKTVNPRKYYTYDKKLEQLIYYR